MLLVQTILMLLSAIFAVIHAAPISGETGSAESVENKDNAEGKEDGDPVFTHFVYFRINHGDQKVGTIKIGLFGSVVPKTVQNFYELARSDDEKSYKNSIFHRIVDGFLLQGGDYDKMDGTGGESIYGYHFEDENFTLKHDKAGRVSMANSGKDTNGSQFFIITRPSEWLDGKYVVFGQVIEGLELILDTLQKVQVGAHSRPTEPVVIVESWGEFNSDSYVPEPANADIVEVADLPPAGEDASAGTVITSFKENVSSYKVLIYIITAALLAYAVFYGVRYYKGSKQSPVAKNSED